MYEETVLSLTPHAVERIPFTEFISENKKNAERKALVLKYIRKDILSALHQKLKDISNCIDKEPKRNRIDNRIDKEPKTFKEVFE